MKPKHFFPLFLVLLFIASPALTAGKNPVVKDCHQTAMTQWDLDICYGEDAKKAQAELDKELTLIKARMAGNREQLKKLEIAQQAWEAYIHAQVDLLYFDHGGSVVPMCDNIEVANFIRARTKQLKEWSSPVEGDSCGWWSLPPFYFSHE